MTEDEQGPEDIQTVASEAYKWFESRTRDNGERFTCLRDNAPEWLSDLVRTAHGDMLPDDWRYTCIQAAIEHVADCGDEDPHDFADAYVDVYTTDRFRWLASNLDRQGYVDEATRELGQADSIVDAIGQGQYVEAQEVYASVYEALSDQADDPS